MQFSNCVRTNNGNNTAYATLAMPATTMRLRAASIPSCRRSNSSSASKGLLPGRRDPGRDPQVSGSRDAEIAGKSRRVF